MGMIRDKSWVIKTGRMSAVTSGTVNTLREVVHWEQYGELCSEKIKVMGMRRSFAEGGDSGSMVINASGELVGLLTAQDSCASDAGISFINPIQDTHQDVKEQTGGFLSLDS